jgi:Arc/MetJ family transcription regulator
MTTKIAVDDELLEEARKIGGHQTKEEAVITALKEYIGQVKRLRFLELEGTVDFDPKYDYKAERWRKPR